MAADEKHLLIARINGKSSSRRQRAFKDAAATVAAIKRWEAEGFNGFWVYGPATGLPASEPRPAIGQWHREQPDERAAVITRLGGTP